MTGLLDEIMGDQKRGGTYCRTCRWLESRPEAERAQWGEAMADDSYQAPAILRAMHKRGAATSLNSVKAHRRGQHGR